MCNTLKEDRADALKTRQQFIMKKFVLQGTYEKLCTQI